MNLDRKKRIILFVVLTTIYFLFFNVFTFKVHAIEYNNNVELDFCSAYGSNYLLSNCRNFSSSQLTTFKISDEYETEQDYIYNVVSNYSGQADIDLKGLYMRTGIFYSSSTYKHFVWSVYSRIKLDFTVNAYLENNLNSNLVALRPQACTIYESVTESDSPHYFYNIYCDMSSFSQPQFYKYGIVIDNNLNTLFSPIAFGISNINYFDSTESALNYFNLLNNTTSSLNNEDVNDINNILSPNVDNIDNQLGGFANSINNSMSNTPVSGLINLPITFLTGVSNVISGNCQAVNYIELYDYQVVLPCLNLSERLGSVWTIIDTVFSLMLIYSIGKSLVLTFARLSDMDTNIMYECYSEGIRRRNRDIDD